MLQENGSHWESPFAITSISHGEYYMHSKFKITYKYKLFYNIVLRSKISFNQKFALWSKYLRGKNQKEKVQSILHTWINRTETSKNIIYSDELFSYRLVNST